MKKNIYLLLLLTLVSVSAINGLIHTNEELQGHNRFLLFTNNRFIDWIKRIFKKRKQETKAPTKKPTKSPTKIPTKAPTKVPTKSPTKAPTKVPTKSPTKAPTKVPTKSPTSAPISTASLQVVCGFLNIPNFTECQLTTSIEFTVDAVGTTIPTEIGLLRRLTKIDLRSESLTSTIPSSIGDLNNLRILYLSGNSFTGTLPSTLNRLTALEAFWLFNNVRLSGTIPLSMCNNTVAGMLKEIAIDCGRITCSCCRGATC